VGGIPSSWPPPPAGLRVTAFNPGSWGAGAGWLAAGCAVCASPRPNRAKEEIQNSGAKRDGKERVRAAGPRSAVALARPVPHRLTASLPHQEESKSGTAMSRDPAPRRASSSRAASCSTHLRRMVTTRQAGRRAESESPAVLRASPAQQLLAAPGTRREHAPQPPRPLHCLYPASPPTLPAQTLYNPGGDSQFTTQIHSSTPRLLVSFSIALFPSNSWWCSEA
jgi:hypothetical protein